MCSNIENNKNKNRYESLANENANGIVVSEKRFVTFYSGISTQNIPFCYAAQSIFMSKQSIRHCSSLFSVFALPKKAAVTAAAATAHNQIHYIKIEFD